MRIKRKIIQINEELCNGCGNCVAACAEGAVQIIDGKAKIVKDQYCDGLGACIGECPEDALKIIEREADEFDEKAVEEYLKEIQNKTTNKEAELSTSPPASACGCPSNQIQVFRPSLSNNTISYEKSALGHWPVQIRLIPPTAPFLKEAHLLITADCVPAAYPAFHQDFLRGRVVMIGCPKFDDVNLYISKFADIFRTADIKSITVLIMEVPCCSGLPMIVKKSMELSQVTIPITKIIIGSRGNIIAQNELKI